MVRKKKPVDGTPICDPAYVRRIDPLWMPGPVPPCFWEEVAHRRDYLLWSAHRLGFRAMEDFYRLSLSACYEQNFGPGVERYWGYSALEAVQDCFPEYDWKPWLFKRVSKGFWDSPANRRSYMDWLGQRLGYQCEDDWYEVVDLDFLQNRGAGIIRRYHGSPVRAVMDLIPGRNWCEWKFRCVPAGFWTVAKNRHRYMRWLGQRLGYRCRDDWYEVTQLDFLRNKGKGFLDHYCGSPLRAVMDLIPGRNWCEWRFQSVPDGFWDVAQNRHRYLRWLGRELGFRRLEDWYRIRTEDLACRHGGALLHRGFSLCELMLEFLPQLDRNRIEKRRPIRIEEVLAWADAHYAKYGAWPTLSSGEIPATGLTWAGVNHCLWRGFRGLPGQTTLAKLLEKHRGVPFGRRPPDLSEEQVLAWADAHFAANGKWPTEKSGTIPGTKETWSAIANAMRQGSRGFPPGSSLVELLAQRRGVCRPPLTEEQILAWASAHFKATGRWPVSSRATAQPAGETWAGINQALRTGFRGLPGGSTLAQLLAQRCGVRNPMRLPPLTEQQILAWARAHFQATGQWPIKRSGAIAQSPGDTWARIDEALRAGRRGLPDGSSLAKLLREHGLK